VFEPYLIQVATLLFSGGAAWGGAKVALNGTRERVKKVEETLQRHTDADEVLQREVIDRLARIETKLERRNADEDSRGNRW
jgi:hypothetical protein